MNMKYYMKNSDCAMIAEKLTLARLENRVTPIRDAWSKWVQYGGEDDEKHLFWFLRVARYLGFNLTIKRNGEIFENGVLIFTYGRKL